MQRDIRIGQTLGERTFVLTKHLYGEGPRRLYLAHSVVAPMKTFLASVAPMRSGFDPGQLLEEVGAPVPGVMDLSFIGHLDIQGEDLEETSFQEGTWAMLERAPDEWLPDLLARSWSASSIIKLAISVGEIASRASAQGAQMGHVRPEYILAKEEGERLIATQLSHRYPFFFRYQHRHTSSVMFKRGYYAPEPHFNDRSLTFTLATMLAEWLTGAFPFPDSWLGNPSLDFLEGRASLNGLPSDLEQVLRRGFTADPAQRPALPEFLEELAGLPA